jgi:hypothetical protein
MVELVILLVRLVEELKDKIQLLLVKLLSVVVVVELEWGKKLEVMVALVVVHLVQILEVYLEELEHLDKETMEVLDPLVVLEVVVNHKLDNKHLMELMMPMVVMVVLE